jgi:hypothetical protein
MNENEKSILIEKMLCKLIYERDDKGVSKEDLELILKEKLLHKGHYDMTVLFMASNSEEIFQLINVNDNEFNKFKLLISSFMQLYDKDLKATSHPEKEFWQKFKFLNEERPKFIPSNKIETNIKNTTEKKEIIKTEKKNVDEKLNKIEAVKTQPVKNIEPTVTKVAENLDKGSLKNTKPSQDDKSLQNISQESSVNISINDYIFNKPIAKQVKEIPVNFSQIFKSSTSAAAASNTNALSDFIINNNGDAKSKDDHKNIDSLIPADGNLLKKHKDALLGNELFSKFGFFSDGKSLANLDNEHRLKFISFYLKVFPLFSSDQRAQIVKKIEGAVLNSFIDEDSINRLKSSLMFQKEKARGHFSKDLITTIIKTTLKGNSDFVGQVIKLKDLVLCKTEEDVKELFLLYILNKAYKVIPHFFEKKMTVYLYIMLMKNAIFLGKDDFLLDLVIIKAFFSDLTYEQFERNPKKQLMFKGLSFSRHLPYDIKFKDLFTQEEGELANFVLNSIGRFYNIEHSCADLLNENNIEFTMNIVELVLRKRNSRDLIVKSMCKLEARLYQNYLRLNADFAENNKTINSQALYPMQYELYKRIHKYCKHIASKLQCSFKLYPYGSISQFLGSLTADLDLYLEISEPNGAINNETSVTFMYAVRDNIDKYFKEAKNLEVVVSARLATISFFVDKIKIDINYFGIPGVLNSTLLRCYALCDVRFPILAINFKDFLKRKNLNNSKIYLNSFTWMMLLITYLQDIVKPPILPKLLKEKEFKFIKVEKNKRKPKTGEKVRYRLEDLGDTEMDDYHLCDSFWDDYLEVYNRQIPVKNDKTLSELYLKFIEFMAFYFKYDAVYVDGTVERFVSKSEHRQYSKGLFNFDYFNDNNGKNGLVVRDPFDHTYNPARVSEDKREELFSSLRSYYYDLIENKEADN